MPAHPGIVGLSHASPPLCFTQEELSDRACDVLFGPEWPSRQDVAEEAGRISHLFAATAIRHRQFAVEPSEFYGRRRSTGERMAAYRSLAAPLGQAALCRALDTAPDVTASAVTHFIVVSCTGYSAPGVDVTLARDCGMRPDVQRTVVGHMGCYGAIVGLRVARDILRSQSDAVVALLAVELCSLHCRPETNVPALTAMALFGDAAAAAILRNESAGDSVEIVHTHCSTVYGAESQMAWEITDEGFEMALSQRVPVTLRRHVAPAIAALLEPQGLRVDDIAHWLVHPGGPSILDAAQSALCLLDDHMRISWDVLRDHGNCSSTTVLLMLDRVVRSGQARRGEWGVMMAFGPGLTLETCLLRF